jgi:hypothetical protein
MDLPSIPSQRISSRGACVRARLYRWTALLLTCLAVCACTAKLAHAEVRVSLHQMGAWGGNSGYKHMSISNNPGPWTFFSAGGPIAGDQRFFAVYFLPPSVKVHGEHVIITIGDATAGGAPWNGGKLQYDQGGQAWRVSSSGAYLKVWYNHHHFGSASHGIDAIKYAGKGPEELTCQCDADIDLFSGLSKTNTPGADGYLAEASGRYELRGSEVIIYDDCTPKTCQQVGAHCGAADDGCGNTIQCGDCGSHQSCVNHECCQWTTCAAHGAECGQIANGCGAMMDCGSCGDSGACEAHRCNWFPKGHLDEASCGQIAGWAQDRNTADHIVTVRIGFDGEQASNARIQVHADQSRADLCAPLGSCNHAFKVDVPMSLRDYATHSVRVYAVDTGNGKAFEITGSPTSFACHAPTGHLDAADCDGFRGWVHDQDTPSSSLEVHIALDGAGFENAPIVLTADKARSDLCGPLGSCNHGFAIPMPVFMRNSVAHTVRVFGKDTQGGAPTQIAGSPKTFTCDPPTLALSPSQGVLRPITSMQVFDAWRFSMLWDVAQYPDKALLDYSTDEPFPAKPHLVRADDGSSYIWLLDNHVRRHVPSTDAMSAWRLDPASVTRTQASEILQWRRGSNLRAAPFLLKGSGDTLYVLDNLFRYESRESDDPVLRESDTQQPQQTLRQSPSAVDDPNDASGCTCRSSSPHLPIASDWMAALGCVSILPILFRRNRRPNVQRPPRSV